MMNKTFFYVLGLLILQLSFFGCFNPKNELNTNKSDESQIYDETLSENITSNIDTTTSNNSTSKIKENDPNSFTPLQEEEVFICDYVSNNNVSIKIKNNTNNNNELKSYNVNYLVQSEDEKKVLLQTREKGKINLLLIDGPQGKIKTIYMHGYPLTIETTPNFELLMIFNESKEVIIYNTELDEIIFQETIEFEEIYEPVPFYSEFENKFIIYLNDDEYDYVKLKKYLVQTEGKFDFNKVLADASSRFPNDLMDSIEPFDYDGLVDYNHAYLSGFLAEKYDVSETDGLERAKERTMTTSVDLVENTVFHQMKSVVKNGMEIKQKHCHYIMLPVWMVNIQYKDKSYTFAMNGQTGKIVGNIPIGIKETIIWSIIIFIGFFILFFIGFFVI